MSSLPRPTLTLVVANPETLAGRFSVRHCFDSRGGYVGSDPEACDWTLPDTEGAVRPVHASLHYRDGRFILRDESGATYINGATRALGRGQPVALSEGDLLVLGRYQLEVHMDHVGPSSAGDGDLEALTGGRTAVIGSDRPPLMAQRMDLSGDPLAALGPSGDSIDLLPPRDNGQARSPLANEPPQVGPDCQDGRVSRMQRPEWSAEPVAPADAVQPLLDGLGVTLDFHDPQERAVFLAEAGEALKATVKGLLALHRARRQGASPWPEWRMQPIEDNPLRLDQGYPETVRTLFSAERSPVHLAPGAAITEALSQLDHHQRATEVAIEEGLQALLEALAPDALLRRFQAYGPPAGPAERDEAWTWRMYCHYFDELASDRQQGFGRLFWAVFGQAYDQVVQGQPAGQKR